MKFKNSSVHAQKQMNDHFKNCRGFVKIYIDDIIIFNKILKEHVEHLHQIFRLLRKINITLKFFKTFFAYSKIVLLNQKIDNFELITAKEKLKIISILFFFKTLKKFEIYLKMIDYFKNYIFYYAQKTKSLQRRKTMLLKNSFNQDLKKNRFLKKNI